MIRYFDATEWTPDWTFWYEGPGWYFSDETGHLNGPFGDEMEAHAAEIAYAAQLSAPNPARIN